MSFCINIIISNFKGYYFCQSNASSRYFLFLPKIHFEKPAGKYPSAIPDQDCQMVQSGDAHCGPFLSGQWTEHVSNISVEVDLFHRHGGCRIALRIPGRCMGMPPDTSLWSNNGNHWHCHLQYFVQFCQFRCG